ncbi:unnamed protein product [Adineta steineri]|uniref:Uncharacterized protein n=1 Tax=Adineta steineri TaxID=433720 RepID=A0A814X3V2_9BILA|nr:unnamed protein product [Adineta steineri]
MDKNQFLNSLKDSAGNIERVEELEKELENENNNETAEQKKERLFQRGLVAFFAELTLRNRDRELENQLKLNNKTGAILIVGLAKCGKTTILKTIKENNGGHLIINNLNNEKPDSFSSAGIDAVFFLIDIYNTSDSFNTRSFQYLIEGDEVNIHLLRNARDYSVRLLNLLGLSF